MESGYNGGRRGSAFQDMLVSSGLLPYKVALVSEAMSAANRLTEAVNLKYIKLCSFFLIIAR